MTDSVKKKETRKYLAGLRSEPPLPLKECVYFNPGDALFSFLEKNYTKGKWKINNAVFPSSFRFYSNPIIKKDSFGLPWLNLELNRPLQDFLAPFYFKKTEVTNAEYKEFVAWVRDSIARRLLANNNFAGYIIKGTTVGFTEEPMLDQQATIPWASKIDSISKVLDQIRSEQPERFYKVKQIETRKLIYVYYEDGIKHLVAVYPDTLSWTIDFPYAYNEPMTNHYFWHPAYNNYPVVGVSQTQAIAFLHWKTEMKKQELHRKGLRYKIEYLLPSEYEWEVVATAETTNKKPDAFPYNYLAYRDNEYLTDLSLSLYKKFPLVMKDEKMVPSKNTTWERRDLNIPHIYYKTDGYFLTSLADISKEAQKMRKNELLISNLDCNDISHMGGNVSELMRDTYRDNWLPVFKARQTILRSVKGADAELILSTEAYYDARNDSAGVLVRGSNWYDERYANMGGKNTGGMNAKLFVNPNFGSHCTLGFRYVVKVSEVLQK